MLLLVRFDRVVYGSCIPSDQSPPKHSMSRNSLDLQWEGIWKTNRHPRHSDLSVGVDEAVGGSDLVEAVGVMVGDEEVN